MKDRANLKWDHDGAKAHKTGLSPAPELGQSSKVEFGNLPHHLDFS
jgi:hypothetical protein